MDVSDKFPVNLRKKFEFFSYNHAYEIITQAFPEEYGDLIKALEGFEISYEDISKPGGNESDIPRKFNEILDPLGWEEIRISGDLTVNVYPRSGDKKGRFSDKAKSSHTIENYIDGHNIDFVKDRVAIDFEWNSKDQTYDRDLFAMRTYYDCDIISVGVIVTRSEDLIKVFNYLGKDVAKKYGASTTWMGKLIPRLDSRRHGGCPILAIGILPECVKEWKEAGITVGQEFIDTYR